MEGRELKANEFSFVLKDSEGKTLETVSNDAAGNVKFKALEFKKGQEGVHNYTVEEVKGTDATVTYDTMKANVTVTVSHDGTAKDSRIATVGDIADKEFNNRVTPPETPEFNPEKYVLNEKNLTLLELHLLMMIKNWQTSMQIQMRTHMLIRHPTTKQQTSILRSVKPGENLFTKYGWIQLSWTANNTDHINQLVSLMTTMRQS